MNRGHLALEKSFKPETPHMVLLCFFILIRIFDMVSMVISSNTNFKSDMVQYCKCEKTFHVGYFNLIKSAFFH